MNLDRRSLIAGGLAALVSSRLARAQFPRAIIQPVAAESYSFQTTAGPWFTYPNNGNPLIMTGMAKSGAPLIWDWGDGTQYIGTIAPPKTYASGAVRTITITAVDGLATMTQLVIQGPSGGPNPFTGDGTGANPYKVPLSDFSAMTGLQQMLSCDTFWNGPFPVEDMSIFPSLYHFDIQGNAFSSLPLFTNCSALGYVDMHLALATAAPLPDFRGCPNLQHLSAGDAQPLTTMASFAGLTNLQYVDAGSFSSGPMGSFAGCTALEHLSLNGGGSFAPICSDLSTCTALTDIAFTVSSMTGVVPGSLATQKNLAGVSFYYCALNAAAVNQVLADLVASLSLSGRVACSVNLTAPSMAAPTGQGLVDKATLNGTAGWSVSTN
jgi:hypothetical protein